MIENLYKHKVHYLLAVAVGLIVIFSLLGGLDDQVGALSAQNSVEVGVTAVSPAGLLGGLAIPASCPSYAHSIGECGCTPGGASIPVGFSININSSPSNVSYGSSANLTWLSNGELSSECTITGSNGDSWSFTNNTGTTITTSALLGDTVYQLQCVGRDVGATSEDDGQDEAQNLCTTVTVTPPPASQCSDGIDNADPEDTIADFPNDPGCTDPSDNDETDPPPPAPQCSDFIDNDGDGLADFPKDPGCTDSTDNDETDTPPLSLPNLRADNGDPIALVDAPWINSGILTEGSSLVFASFMTNVGAGDVTTEFDGRFQIDVGNDGVYDINDDLLQSVIGLQVGEVKTLVSNPWNNVPAGDHAVRFCVDIPGNDILESNEGNNCGLNFSFTVAPSPPASQCSDGIDNDGDKQIDFPNDPGCLSGSDNDETDTPPPPPASQCSDGIDNDGDGQIDFPNDQGCTSDTDNTEGEIAINASPSLIRSGDSSTVSWTITGAPLSCNVTGPGIFVSNGDPVPPSDSRGTGPLTEASTYTIVCDYGAGEIQDSSTVVVVLPKFEEF